MDDGAIALLPDLKVATNEMVVGPSAKAALFKNAPVLWALAHGRGDKA